MHSEEPVSLLVIALNFKVLHFYGCYACRLFTHATTPFCWRSPLMLLCLESLHARNGFLVSASVVKEAVHVVTVCKYIGCIYIYIAYDS